LPEQWLTEIFGFQVEKLEIPRRSGLPYAHIMPTGRGVLHTTEGSSLVGAVSSLRVDHFAPHFITGEGRIIQTRPIGVQASALHDPMNHDAYVQIEMVGITGNSTKTQTAPWLPGEGTLKPTVAIMAYASKALGIPLRAPFATTWKDDCSDMPLPWATNNRRRKIAAQGGWTMEMGWWMHLEVPMQGPSWHYDCGALGRSQMIEMASALLR
jgi:hypothetical protein